MELSPAQCGAVAQIIPVLLLAVLVERRIFLNAEPRLAGYSLALTMIVSIGGMLFAITGVDDGLPAEAGIFPIAGLILPIIDLATATAVDLRADRKRVEDQTDSEDDVAGNEE